MKSFYTESEVGGIKKMINTLKNLLAKRRKKQREESYQCGYDWAAGQILRGAKPAHIEIAVYCEDDTPMQNSFSKGANAAVATLVSLGVCEDDRVGV